MEVRNNPSFGMAFIKPKAEDIAGFTKYVTRGRRPKMIARGLTQLQKAHANDQYVDIHFLPDAKGFSVIPKVNTPVERTRIESVLGGTSRPFYSDTVNPARIDRVAGEVNAELERLEKSGASKLKLSWTAVKGFCRVAKEVVRVIVSPKEILPADLRAASAEAARIEQGVGELLAKEVAKTQRRLATEKLINNSLK